MTPEKSQQLQLILASQSPRRKELLGWLGIPFKISPSNVEEKTDLTEPGAVSEELARLKGRDILEQSKGGAGGCLVVASDTLVCLKGKIYGKPRDREHAKQILQELCGHTHEVISSLYLGLYCADKTQVREHLSHTRTKVTFAAFNEHLIERYLDSGDSLDKAGAYGIQGPSLTFIKKIEGSYSNVVGLALAELVEQMSHFLGEHCGYRSDLGDYFVK